MSYPNVEPQPQFPQLETEVLAFWEADSTFVASVEQRERGVNGANEYVFYDGPPFAAIARVIFQVTESMLGPVRRVLPLAGPLDLSPIVVILFLQIVVQGLILNC